MNIGSGFNGQTEKEKKQYMQNIYTFEESKDGYFNVKVDKGWLSFVKEEDLKIMQCTG